MSLGNLKFNSHLIFPIGNFKIETYRIGVCTMKSKSLEALLARESGQYTDMVTRFQKMRDFGQMSKGRGRNAEFLSPDEIVAGIFSLASEKPGFAAVTAIGLMRMLPVGLPEDAFAQAPTLSEALVAALASKKLRETIVEVRLGDSDPQAHNSTTAAIVYRDGGKVLTSQYIGSTALSLFAKGKEKEFDRRSFGAFSMAREMVVSPRLLNEIANQMERAIEQQRLDKMTSTPILSVNFMDLVNAGKLNEAKIMLEEAKIRAKAAPDMLVAHKEGVRFYRRGKRVGKDGEDLKSVSPLVGDKANSKT
jgi:hypothetical protein